MKEEKRNYIGCTFNCLKTLIAILLFLPSLLMAQQGSTLLVVPLQKKNIHLNSAVKKNLTYNNITEDSLRTYIVENLNAEVKDMFTGFNLYFLDEYAPSFFSDSGISLKQWNCFYRNLNTGDVHNTWNGGSKDSYRNQYYGINLSNALKDTVKQIADKLNCDFILFLNEFETTTSRNTFSLSCEIMDKNIERVYGNKNEIKEDVVRNMYPDVLKFYVRETGKMMLTQVKTYLEGNPAKSTK